MLTSVFPDLIVFDILKKGPSPSKLAYRMSQLHCHSVLFLIRETVSEALLLWVDHQSISSTRIWRHSFN